LELRKLKPEDAPLMLEWMHDESVTRDLQTDFASKTMGDALSFINNSLEDKENLNLAIVDDNDEYMGTVSLKHICAPGAEFAITIRSCAMGKGFSAFGMKEIMKIASKDYGLKYVYWCVSPDNARAVRFYDKNGYERVSSDCLDIKGSYTEEQILKYYWYINRL
jgi:diamine N-acetyltransferase